MSGGYFSSAAAGVFPLFSPTFTLSSEGSSTSYSHSHSPSISPSLLSSSTLLPICESLFFSLKTVFEQNKKQFENTKIRENPHDADGEHQNSHPNDLFIPNDFISIWHNYSLLRAEIISQQNSKDNENDSNSDSDSYRRSLCVSLKLRISESENEILNLRSEIQNQKNYYKNQIQNLNQKTQKQNETQLKQIQMKHKKEIEEINHQFQQQIRENTQKSQDEISSLQREFSLLSHQFVLKEQTFDRLRDSFHSSQREIKDKLIHLEKKNSILKSQNRCAEIILDQTQQEAKNILEIITKNSKRKKNTRKEKKAIGKTKGEREGEMDRDGQGQK